MSSYSNFAGKVVIVTGAGSGIGKATAKKFASFGAILALIDLNAQTLADVAEQCDNIAQPFGNPKAFTFVGDLTKDEVRQQFVDETVKSFNKIDVLVNNAGMVTDCSIFDSSMEAADKHFSILLRAPYDMCRLAANHLVKSKGVIVNIASIAGHNARYPNPAYNAAKAAIINLTKTLSNEFGEFGVRVNSVSPGAIVTNIIPMKGGQILSAGKKWSSLGRLGESGDVANVICFLASDESNYMTGSDVLVDGGMMQKSVK